MLARSTAARSAVRTAQRRAFSTHDAAGVKVLARDDLRPTSEVAVIVKAGSRYNTTPGLAHILEKFAFKNTANRSALRLTRESEILGGHFSTALTRDYLVLSAKFLREDLPFYLAALSDTLANTVFAKYELVEDVIPVAVKEANAAAANAAYVSSEAAYQAAFRSGLGSPLLAEAYSPVTLEQVKSFASEVYTKANITVVGSSVIEHDFASLVGQHFGGLPVGTPIVAPPSKAFAGDVRIKSSGPSALTIAFPTTSPSPALAVLANVLGGPSSIKNSPGSTLLGAVAAKTSTSITTSYTPHSDAGLLAVTISGASAAAIADAAAAAASHIKSAASTLDVELIQKAVSHTRFAAAAANESNIVAATTQSTDLVASVDAVVEAASALSSGPVAVGAVGQVQHLPYGNELF